jgi:hypothetical protein
MANSVEKLPPSPDARNHLRCGRCFLSVVRGVPDATIAHIAVVRHVPTEVGARTGTLDPITGRIHTMVAFGPACGRRRPRAGAAGHILQRTLFDNVFQRQRILD